MCDQPQKEFVSKYNNVFPNSNIITNSQDIKLITPIDSDGTITVKANTTNMKNFYTTTTQECCYCINTDISLVVIANGQKTYYCKECRISRKL